MSARSVAEAVQLVALHRIDVALVDWKLQAGGDGRALGLLLRQQHGIPYVLFSAFLDPKSTNDAHLLGAAYVVEKPLYASILQAALEAALRQPPLRAADVRVVDYGSASSAEYWARIVLTASRGKKDPRLEADIAAANIISVGAYRDACDACDVSGRNTKDLARFIRAEAIAVQDGSMVRDHLSIRHRKTRRRLFELAGLPPHSRFVPIRQFLLSQRLVPTEKQCFRELAHQLANDPLFLDHFCPDDPPVE